MSLIETRHHQMFPVFDRAQIETAKRFASGPARNFAPGEVVFEAGERNAPAWLVLKGSIDVVRRDGLNRESPITSHGPGQFSGEVSQLAGAGMLASGRAGPQGCTALPFDAAHDDDGRAVVERFGVLPDELPLMVCPNGTVLKRPTDAEAGVILGITPELDPQMVFDVAVVGAGPAGLAAAVYGASEGLSVLV